MKRTGILCVMVLVALSLMAATPAKKKHPKEKPIKHYLDIHAGSGVSSMGYTPEGGRLQPGASFSIGAGYTWFFRPYMGLQTGIQMTRVASTASLTEGMEWSQWQDGSPLTDYMGEAYIHRTSFAGWKEKQEAYLLQIPIGLRFRYFRDRESMAGLHAAFGAKLSLPVLSRYAHTSGTVTHTGWYPQWQLELYDLPGRFETEPFTTKQEESLGSRLHKVNAEAYAELGTIIRLNRKTELFFAAYAQYMLNDFSAVKRDDRKALGFSNAHNNYAFMEAYRGLIGTDHVGAMHPWAAGIKIGVSLWPGKTEKEKKRELKRLLKQFPDAVPPVYVHDTLYIHDSVYVHDTICPQSVLEKAQAEQTEEPRAEEKAVAQTAGEAELETLLLEAVIWFHYDEYNPILEPAYVLDSVVAVMKRYPELKIQVNGHACQLGTEGYNQRLALLRARAVADLLEQKGVPSQRMSVKSYGERVPYRYNTEKQLSKDRRVEIIPEQSKMHKTP